MTDIVERLRSGYEEPEGPFKREAADEIERLRKLLLGTDNEIARLCLELKNKKNKT